MNWVKHLGTLLKWKQLGYAPRIGILAACVGSGVFAGYSALMQAQDGYPLAQRWERRVPITLVDRIKVCEDTELIRFELPNSYDMTGHDIISSVKLITPYGTARYYTVISPPDQRGYIDFLIKRMHHGRMALELDNFRRGSILFMGNWYKEHRYKANEFEKVGWIASGSGLSPLLSILRVALYDDSDKTKFSLLYFNKDKERTPYYDGLLKLQEDFPDRLQVNFGYTTKGTHEVAKGEYAGNLTQHMIEETMPKPSENCKIFVCGTEGLTRAAAGKPISWITGNNRTGTYWQGLFSGLLKDMGYSRSQVYKFGYTIYVY
jgi:cytochrome-b5 reductase